MFSWSALFKEDLSHFNRQEGEPNNANVQRLVLDLASCVHHEAPRAEKAGTELRGAEYSSRKDSGLLGRR